MAQKLNLKSSKKRRKGCVLFPYNLSKELLLDIYKQANLNAQRDVEELKHRFFNEGLSFLTKTLPKLGKNLISVMAGNNERLDPKLNFKNKDGIPLFLNGLLRRVLNPGGTLKDVPDVPAINDILQFCLLWYKLEDDFSDDIKAIFSDRYQEIDAGLPRDFAGASDIVDRILRYGNDFLIRKFDSFDYESIVPHHGPGAVFEQVEQHQKFDFAYIYPSCERCYPIHEYGFCNKRHFLDEFINYTLLKPAIPCCRVHFVPKDSRGPRVIAAEPSYLQYLQQGLKDKIVDFLESTKPFKGHVNFSDQGVNQNLALNAQKDGWATIDLKDASDSVSRALVFQLFGGSEIYKPLMCTRSVNALLPNGKKVKLNKFASMGSATCFPVEALVFYTLSVFIQVCVLSKSLSFAQKNTYVYGDDIIVKQEVVNALLEYFPKFGLKINHDKTCYRGRFFESCGVDVFDGINISSLKIKSLPPISPTDGAGLIRYIDYSNILFSRCYYGAAELIKNYLEKLYGKIPISCGDPHRVSLLEEKLPGAHVLQDRIPSFYTRLSESIASQGFDVRWNSTLHRREFKTLILKGVTHKRFPSPWKELLRNFTSNLGTRTWIYPLRKRVRLLRRFVSC